MTKYTIRDMAARIGWSRDRLRKTIMRWGVPLSLTERGFQCVDSADLALAAEARGIALGPFPPDMLTLSEAARRRGVSRQAMYEWTQKHKIPTRHDGHYVYVREQDVLPAARQATTGGGDDAGEG